MSKIYLYIAVEGKLDEIIIRRIIEFVGDIEIVNIFVARSKNKLLKNLKRYNQAAENIKVPWFILVDLDRYECAPSMVRRYLPDKSMYMCFRLAVKTVESWLIADKKGIARFFRISEKHVPRDPESIEDPKTTLVNLARKSKIKSLREDIVPKPDTGSKVGPLYVRRMQEFINELWDIETAKSEAKSLDKALNCLERLKTLQ